MMKMISGMKFKPKNIWEKKLINNHGLLYQK